MVGGETDQGVKAAEADAARRYPEWPVAPKFGQHLPEVSPALKEADPHAEEQHHVSVPQRGRPVPVAAFEAHGPVEDKG